MRRRDLLSLVAGVTAWPAVARAQQPGSAQRIGILTGLAESDPATHARLGAFRSGLAALGWIEGRNLRLDTRFAPVFPAPAKR